jgi:hypothetical protein
MEKKRWIISIFWEAEIENRLQTTYRVLKSGFFLKKAINLINSDGY